ncbi:MAG: DNA polymerase III subunit beta [Flavobacteriales bacterium]
MKFIISSSVLHKQLQSISGVLGTNSSLPILDDFLFDVQDGEITIYASDLENTMSTRVKVEDFEPGRIAIPGKFLLDTLKSFADHPLTFIINHDNFSVNIVSSYGNYNIMGHDPDEYPKIPALQDGSNFKIDGSVLFEGINKTIYATANDDLRPTMTGVYLQIDGDGLTMVATDSHRLVKFKRTDVKSNEPASFILPKKPLNLLKSLLGNVNSLVDVNFNAKNASFSFENQLLICRLIEGKYPNYEAVIPKDSPFYLQMNRIELLSSLRRVSVFSSKSTSQIRMSIRGNQLQVSAEDLDLSNSAIETLACTYEGEDIDMGFNSRFINEMLANLGTEMIRLELSTPSRPGVLLPEGDNLDPAEDLLMIVMPVMLNN